MGMQTSTMLIMLAACILLFGEMVSTDEIVCKGDTPIKCPVTGVCCEIDHFCHTGLCRPCIPPGMSRDELLVKCKKMTIVQLMGEFNPQCQDICQRIFTFEDLNKKQNSEINDLKQKVDEILQILKQTNSQEQIKDLVTETYKESKRIQETDEKISVLKGWLIAIGVILAVTIIMGVYFHQRQWKNKKDIETSGKNKDEMQNLIKSENKRNEKALKKLGEECQKSIEDKVKDEKDKRIQENEALRLEINKIDTENSQLKTSWEENLNLNRQRETVTEAMKKDLKGMNKLVDTKLNQYNEALKHEINDLKQQNLNLKDEVGKQAETLSSLKREIDDVKPENSELRNLLKRQEEKLKAMETDCITRFENLESRVKTFSQFIKKRETPPDEESCANDLSIEVEGDKAQAERFSEGSFPYNHNAQVKGKGSYVEPYIRREVPES